MRSVGSKLSQVLQFLIRKSRTINSIFVRALSTVLNSVHLRRRSKLSQVVVTCKEQAPLVKSSKGYESRPQVKSSWGYESKSLRSKLSQVVANKTK